LSKIFTALISDNKRITSNHYLLTLHPLQRIIKPQAGQFFMVSLGDCLDPLLRRPFSLYRWFGGDFQILYRVVGKGTEILSRKRGGERIDILGPLGRGFPVDELKKERIILVAGGLGIAPIFALAEDVKKRAPILFYGAVSSDTLLCQDEIRSMGIKTFISTEDGTIGRKGVITDLLIEYLDRTSSFEDNPVIYSCGPVPMLKRVSDIIRRYRLQGFVSTEEKMACGIGACLGCIIKTKDGYRRVCKDGPVFLAEEIIW